MSKRLDFVFCRSHFADSDAWSEALYYGGALPGDDFDLSHVTGYFGAKLRAMYEEPPDTLSNYDYEQKYQAQRPDIFLRKLPDRRRFFRASPGDATQNLRSTLITAEQFIEHYEAAAFAFDSSLNCETAVTLWWGKLGATDASEAQKLFSSFTKAMNDWLFERDLPTVYFFSHENSAKIGLHTHLAVYLALPTFGKWSIRDGFREWAMGWPLRIGLGDRPRAIRVTGPMKRTPWLHWYRFHYQMKGYDPREVVRRACNSPFGADVMLGDLIAYRQQDPGVVAMRPRVGHAINLGPARREIGIPAGCDELRSEARRTPPARRELSFAVAVFWAQLNRLELPRSPYRSPYKDGWRDVRMLYPKDFRTRVTKLSYEPAPPPPAPVPSSFLSGSDIL